MVPINSKTIGALEWRQPSALSRVFELKSGDSKLAELRFMKALGTLAMASTAGSEWTFKRSGFLNPVVSARVEGSEAEVASFRAKYTARSGSLVVGAETLSMRALNFWGSEWGMEDSSGRLLMRMHERGTVHFSAKYEVTEDGKARPDISLLLCLSWYVLVLMSEDSAA